MMSQRDNLNRRILYEKQKHFGMKVISLSKHLSNSNSHLRRLIQDLYLSECSVNLVPYLEGLIKKKVKFAQS